MKGLTTKTADILEKIIDSVFNSLTLRLLGIVPKISRTKSIVFRTSKDSLTSLFLKQLGTTEPTKSEEDTLKVLLRIANGYADALRDRTKTKVLQNVDSYLKGQSSQDKPIKIKEVKNIVNTELDKAKNHFKLIAGTEGHKCVNTANALSISKLASNKGIEDPTVFFSVIKDDRTGFYEFVLHTLDDKVTPRVWKLSEIDSNYYKNGNQYPSISGLHPNCRCILTFLSPGFGFDEKGKLKYKGPKWDEFEHQRELYGLPSVPARPTRKINKNEKLMKGEMDDYIPTEHGEEHPQNEGKHPTRQLIGHQANNGKVVWTGKMIKNPLERNSYLNADQMDALHKQTYVRYATKNNIKKNPDFRESLVGLNSMIKNDNDRHLRTGRTGVNSNFNHQEMRQRHIIKAMAGHEGYSIDHVKTPEGNHIGIRIKAPRHHKSGDLGETSWFWDGKSLKTESNKIIGRWK